MAHRPVFLPVYHGPLLVQERTFSIKWAPGFSETQKKKNIKSLHYEARRHGIARVLEISSKSDTPVGQRLSAFSLKIHLDAGTFPLESVYQGSKVFHQNGPFVHVFEMTPRAAKKYIRSLECGTLTGFRLSGQSYPLSPKNAFYDWLYIRSLRDHADWIEKNVHYDAFTDIEFNPAKQVNCQARAFSEYLSLMKRGTLNAAADDFGYFAAMLSSI